MVRSLLACQPPALCIGCAQEAFGLPVDNSPKPFQHWAPHLASILPSTAAPAHGTGNSPPHPSSTGPPLGLYVALHCRACPGHRGKMTTGNDINAGILLNSCLPPLDSLFLVSMYVLFPEQASANPFAPVLAQLTYAPSHLDASAVCPPRNVRDSGN
eukprot:1075696-Pelagomonas_calceolata.AAC.5